MSREREAEIRRAVEAEATPVGLSADLLYLLAALDATTAKAEALAEALERIVAICPPTSAINGRNERQVARDALARYRGEK